MPSFPDQIWHHLSVEETVARISADPQQGLNESEAAARLERFGPNQVTEKKGKSPLLRFVLQFNQPLIYILLAAAAITALLQEWVDASVIFGVVLVNAMVGFLQESKAEKAIAALKRMVSAEATVLRSGRRRRVPTRDIVPGDVVFIQSGDKVPADMRLFEVKNLRVDEAALTGESVPVEKHFNRLEADLTLGDRRNMAYSGTLVTYGQAQGLTVATGDRTETGRIARMITEAADLSTPLTRKIAQFSRLLLYVILGLAAVTFWVGLSRGESAVEMFLAAVALAVGAIPEGLPAAVTVTLAIGVNQMAQRRAIIRKLPAVETLGSTTVICSDKTGTLTENQMTVQRIYAAGAHYSVTGIGYAPDGHVLRDGEPVKPKPETPLYECLAAGLLCNDARVAHIEGRWQITGDPTEAALIVSARKAGQEQEDLAAARPRLDLIPFESERQYMATLHAAGPGHAPRVYLKGSVEKVLDHCRYSLGPDGRRPLDRQALLQVADAMAGDGLRVLAFARDELPVRRRDFRGDETLPGLTFLGFQAMIDPPRAEAVSAIAACRSAGIRVKMITGDHALTARVIGAQLGLGPETGALPRAVTGRELERLSGEDYARTAREAAVFARVAPEQKLKLVQVLQAQDEVIAMTGDGVNDAPALKQANIGVAMGITGTEVSKEAADMLLTDDNFASIEAAVEEGRGVFDNLTKFIIWTLPTNMGEGLVILAAIFLGVTLPILPVQILWINMTTAVLLGLMLAFEPKEKGIMERPPRSPSTPILTGELIFRISLVGTVLLAGAFGLFVWEQEQNGLGLKEARTVAVNVFVFGELFYLFNCRSLKHSAFNIGFFSNPWVIGGSALMVLLQLIYTYTPPMNAAFHSAPLPLHTWIDILWAALAVYFLVGMEKWLRRRAAGRRRGG